MNQLCDTVFILKRVLKQIEWLKWEDHDEILLLNFTLTKNKYIFKMIFAEHSSNDGKN